MSTNKNIRQKMEEFSKRNAPWKPKQSCDYSWVWDMSWKRQEWINTAIERIEAKSLTLLRGLWYFGAALAAWFGFAASHGYGMRWWSLGIGAGIWAILAILSLYALDPIDRWPPPDEQRLIMVAEKYSSREEALGKAAQGMSFANAQSTIVARIKARRLRRALVASAIGIPLIALIIFWGTGARNPKAELHHHHAATKSQGLLDH